MRFVYDDERVCTWVTEKAGGIYTAECRGIGLEKDGILKVGVMYNGYTGDGGSISMHWRCDDPKATSRTFFWAAFHFAFNVCNVNTALGIVHQDNKMAREVDARLGFREVHTLQGYFPDGAGIIYAMNKEDCRWIKRRDGALGRKDHEQKISPAHSA